MEKDSIIQEQKALFVSLQKQLSRQPGIDIAEKLSVHQNEVREKDRQMRAMAGELNMNQAQVFSDSFIQFFIFCNICNFILLLQITFENSLNR